MTTSKKKIRKPQQLKNKFMSAYFFNEKIMLDALYRYNPKEARRLAAWLAKAADWLEQKEKKGKKK